MIYWSGRHSAALFTVCAKYLHAYKRKKQLTQIISNVTLYIRGHKKEFAAALMPYGSSATPKAQSFYMCKKGVGGKIFDFMMLSNAQPNTVEEERAEGNEYNSPHVMPPLPCRTQQPTRSATPAMSNIIQDVRNTCKFMTDI